jgi:hypothetical protein
MGAPQGYTGPVALMKTPDEMGYFVMEQWNGNRSTDYWEKLILWSRDRDVLIVFNGNQHHGSFLFAPEPLFDFYDECVTVLLEGATLVPRRLVEAFFEPSLNQLRRLIPRLLAAGCNSIRVIGTPPPKADIQAFSEIIRRQEFAKRIAERTGIDFANAKVAPALLLLKLWRVIQRITASVATDERVTFVPVPPEALDSQGFLAKHFYDYTPSDITHANSAFAQLMLKHTLSTLTD